MDEKTKDVPTKTDSWAHACQQAVAEVFAAVLIEEAAVEALEVAQIGAEEVADAAEAIVVDVAVERLVVGEVALEEAAVA